MKPITDHVPKPLLPVAGKPLIDRTISALSRYGIKKVGVNLHHKDPMLTQHLASYCDQVCISHETVLLGTGGALRFFEDFLTDRFCVHSGDIMTNADISSIMEFHEHYEPMITLALLKNEKTNYIRIDNDHTVVDIADTPQPNDSDYYTFSGISVFSKQVFSYLPQRDVFGMIEIFHAVQADKGIIKGYPCTMEWYNLNSSRTYWELNRDILNKTVKFNGIDIADTHHIDPSSKITTDDIRGFVSIGANCVIERGVTLENTIVFDDTHIVQGVYYNCIVSDAFCVRVHA